MAVTDPVQLLEEQFQIRRRHFQPVSSFRLE